MRLVEIAKGMCVNPEKVISVNTTDDGGCLVVTEEICPSAS